LDVLVLVQWELCVGEHWCVELQDVHFLGFSDVC
jgi:hypothetical protein